MRIFEKRELRISFLFLILFLEKFWRPWELMWRVGSFEERCGDHQGTSKLVMVSDNFLKLLSSWREGAVEILGSWKVFFLLILEEISEIIHQWGGKNFLLSLNLTWMGCEMSGKVWVERLRGSIILCSKIEKSAYYVHLKRPRVWGYCCKISEIWKTPLEIMCFSEELIL